MARISLRAYNRDIEAMIDKNQIDEAFAHCRYILEIYPKHVDTYRLMGKALLEAQRFSDAADVFHRVLSSIPDDFISHLGMSIIREDESDLDAAIWHMERSFEVQPSNAAVQVELRRLYGLRDGVTPQKIQLTRGGLARMSAKSNLHSQAIAELRAALSNDPQRPDLQVVLAEMYHQTGARMEAIEACNNLINKLPYCLVANRILAEILPETELADQADQYKTRVGELNPYYLQLSPVAPTLEQVPDGAVTIERFEFNGESYASVEGAQPAWATSLGVDLEEEAETEEPEPDWLQEEETAPKTAPEIDREAEQEIVEEEIHLGLSDEDDALEEADLPDWMSEVGEADDTGSLTGAAAVAGAAALGASLIGEDDEGLEEEPVAAPEPEMEQAQEPHEEAPPSTAIAGKPEPAAEDEPDLTAGEEAEIQDDEQLPDWMREPDEADAKDAEGSESLAGAAAVAGAAALGASLISEDEEDSGAGQDQAAAPEDIETLPDWMAEDGETDTIVPAEVESEAAEVSAEQSQEADLQLGASDETEQIPDWMEEAESGMEVETPDWLRDAMEGTEEPGPGAGAVAAGAALIPDSDSEEIEAEPIEGTEVEAEPESAVQFEEPSPDDEVLPVSDGQVEMEEIVDEEFEVQPGGEPAPDIISEFSEEDEFPESIPDWLSEVSPEEIPQEVVEAEADLDIVRAEIPVWLRKMEAQHKAEMESVDRIEDLELDTSFTDLSGEDVPTWLMSAMEPELVSPTGEPLEVDDIGELFEADEPATIDEIGLDTAAEELEQVEVTEQLEEALEEVEVAEQLEQAVEEVEVADQLEEAVEEVEAPEQLEEGVDAAELDTMQEEPAPQEAVSEAEFETGEEEFAEITAASEEAVEEIEVPEQMEEAADVAGLDAMQEEPAPQEAVSGAEYETGEEDFAEITTASEEAVEEIEIPEEMEEAAGLDEMQEESAAQEPLSGAEFETGEEEYTEITAPSAEIEEAAEPTPEADVLEEQEIEQAEESGITGLAAAAAAGVAAAQLFDEDATQPIAVTDEAEAEEEVEAVEEYAEAEQEMDAGVLEEDAEFLEEEVASIEEIEETAAPELAADAPLSGEDEDAAMAWLESLAAKQGASEEELLSSADERKEAPPDWVLEEAAQFIEDEEAQDDERESDLTAAALAGVTAGILSDRDVTEEPEEGDLEPEFEAEATTETEGHPVQPSEWVPEILGEGQQTQVEEAAEEKVIEPEKPDITGDTDVMKELAETADIDREEIEEFEPAEEIPYWLSGIADDQEGMEAETAEWTPAMLAEEEGVLPHPAPAEKIDLNAASLAQLEKIPGVGFIHAQNIVNYRSEEGPFTSLNQLSQVEGLNRDIVADLEEYLTVEVVSEAAAQQEIPDLQDAWSELSGGNIEDALDRYSILINQDQHLDEIIQDLQAAINKYPENSSLYQSLGDAYMHANMLQEALESYSRAEDLI